MVPYILTDQGVLMPQFRAGDWEAIADDALDAMVALLEAVAANGGPDVPEGLRRPVGGGGVLGRSWAGRGRRVPGPGRGGGVGAARQATGGGAGRADAPGARDGGRGAGGREPQGGAVDLPELGGRHGGGLAWSCPGVPQRRHHAPALMAPRAGVLPGFSGQAAGRLGRALLPFALARAPEAPAHGDRHGRPRTRGGVALRPRAVCAPRRWRARRASSLHAPPRRLVPVGAPRLQLDAEPGHRELRTPQSAPPNRVGAKASRWRGLDGSATARGERPARRGHKLPGRVSPQKTWETYGAHGRSGCFPETMTVLEEGGRSAWCWAARRAAHGERRA